MSNQSILELLQKLIAIESVSADPHRSIKIIETANFLHDVLRSMGFKVQQFQVNSSPPLIIASRIISSQNKTIGIYGHYDVQPDDPVSEWKTKPFVLTLNQGKLYGRGVADNKGHVVQNIAAIKTLIDENKLNNNIIFILEGEEEVGSVHLETLLSQVDQKLMNSVDAFYVTDTGMKSKSQPQIFYALRGLIYFEISIKTGKRDLHSGVYGNRVLNPLQILADIIASLKNVHTNKVLIPNFYQDVRQIPEGEMKLLESSIRSEDEELQEAAVYTLTSMESLAPSLVTKIMPSCDVHGIWGGYIGAGAKTVIPKEAHAKFSFRLVENQDADDIEKKVVQFILSVIPEGVKYSLKTQSKNAPFYTDLNNLYISQTASILKDVFHQEVVFNRSGGSIPAAEVFQRVFKKPVILTGFTLPDDCIHSPNENFDEEMFWKGIEVLKRIYSQ